MEQRTSDIEALILEEKRQAAAESHSEAWAEGASAGIEPDIMAEEAMATALRELVYSSGEAVALDLLDRMRDRTRSGEFEPLRHLH